MDIHAFSYHQQISKSFLISNGFRHNIGWSEDGSEAYVAYMPIYRYHGLAVLELRIVLYDNGTTRIDVLDYSTHGIYAAWYRHEPYDKYPILKEIDDNIIKLMTSLGFVKEKESKNGHEKYQSSKTQPELRRNRRTFKTLQRDEEQQSADSYSHE